jgi:hypothetical protein
MLFAKALREKVLFVNRNEGSFTKKRESVKVKVKIKVSETVCFE